jgi:hypothetical protein
MKLISQRIILAVLICILTAVPALAQETFDVTSSSCEGKGSITEAMKRANNNRGIDIINITVDEIDFRNCPPYNAPALGDDYYTLEATESVIFEGNGAKVTGSNFWINDQGGSVELQQCHDEYPSGLLSQSPGFVRVGVQKKDNPDITVTVRDLEFDNLSGLALVERQASLILEGVKVIELVSSTRGCDQNIVKARAGANVTATDTRWFENRVHSEAIQGTAFNGVIAGGDDAGGAGDLTIEDSEFVGNGNAGLVSWFGQAGSQVNIVSSKFENTGGIAVLGESASNIVNSIWASDTLLNLSPDDRTSNSSTEDMNIIASTFLFSNVACDAQCQDSTNPGGGYGIGWLVRLGAGDINFIQSAVEVADPDDKSSEETYVKLLDSSGFSADADTWIRPTADQNAAALVAVTGQQDLRTEQQAFIDILVNPFASYNQWATPVVPGKLIDVIDDAACDDNDQNNDGANALRNPINDTCITEDALGQPRVDVNYARNIGAVQVTAAPHLSVAGVGNETVDLDWTKPRDLAGLCGYQVKIKSADDSYTEDVFGADTLSFQATDLINNTEYEFQVEGYVVCPSLANPFGELSGYPSNTVTATPLAPIIGTPMVTATPGDGQVALSWNQVDLGGRYFDAYRIQWRVAGTDEIIGTDIITDQAVTSITITGLKNGTEYQFSVAAVASFEGGEPEVGEPGAVNATPHGDTDTVNRIPDNKYSPATKEQNKPKYWENLGYGDCTKTEVVDDYYGSVWELLNGASALILKSDLVNDVWINPEPGYYGTASAQDISNVIVCDDNP